MATNHEGEESAELQSLGAAEGLAGTLDPIGVAGSLTRALGQRARDPLGVGGLFTSHMMALSRAATATAGRALGLDVEGPAVPGPKDRRFSEAAWKENAAFFGLMQTYLLSCQLFRDLVEGADLDPVAGAKARFLTNLINDSLAPTNFLLTNPTALRRAAETGGWSVIRGARNMAHDMVHNDGWPRQVDMTPFKVGENMANSPGQVVFRNDLIELIQYRPNTEKTHEIPLLMCPPWINKYYVMDLAPEKSLVQWAVDHGMTAFMISYRNPDASMRDFGFDDYLLKGPRTALDVVREITGADTVNTLSVCLGGTLNTALLAYLDATGDGGLVNSSTSLNCLVDHSDAGILSEVFTDRDTVAELEAKMNKVGYLEATDMARTFDLLRANDLVFSYVSSGWLCGEDPPAFDLLAWNHDSTRMPAKMHSFYLRSCWIDNALAEDRLELAGERLQVSGIDVDSYFVSAIEDHIVPWRNAYRTTQLMKKSDCRFVLSSSGHIAGIVNPPNPKSKLWTNPELPADADAWLGEATESRETWWNDWLEWIVPRSGGMRKPPPMGSTAHPALGPAPGTYVKG